MLKGYAKRVNKTKEQISYNMKRVCNKDSRIEILLRTELWKRGLRYRKNDKSVFGKPDIVYKGKKIAIFVDSEYWHGYNWEEKQKEIKSNREFWITKIERNMARDIEVTAFLQSNGWTVLRFWGKQIMNDVSACADIIELEYRRK